jgi:hypothetical protein
MLVFSLSDGKTEYRYKMPQNAREITCRQIIDFQDKVESKKPETLKDYEATEESERAAFIADIESGEIEKRWTGFYMRELMYWCNIPSNVIGHVPVKRDDGNDLAGLRAILSNAFKVEPETLSGFKYKGERFFLPAAPVNLIDPNTTDFLRGATLGEFATATELYRAYSSMLDGSCLALLNVIAVLCRKKNEVLPSLPDEQSDWIQERIEHLKDLDFNTAMNVGFFLTVPQHISKKHSAFSKLVASLQQRAKSTVTI